MSDYQRPDYQPDQRPWPPQPTAHYETQPSPWPDLRPAYPPPTRRTEPLAIASLVCSFVISLLGIVFGHIALARIRRSGDGGRGLAVAGLVVGYAGLAGGVLAAVLALTLLSSGMITMTARQWIGSGPIEISPSPTPLFRLPDRGPSPANMNANGGITLTAGRQVVPVPASNVDATTLPSPDPAAPTFGNPHAPGIEPAAKGQPAKVVVYMDFMCPACGAFHSSYVPTLDRLRNEGKITVEYRPITILDSESTTRYSSRAAAAAACVADAHPDRYADFLSQLCAHQPAQGSAGLSDQELKSLVAAAGADASTCIDSGRFLAWARYSNRLALDSGINGVPSAFVDGKQWGGGTSTGLDFIRFLQAGLSAREGSGT
ncbi:thioredoxin domain-containing protein [Arthrobacter sp. AZCC_0090]|uniref:thioredoxin domain-containing protein n=1 Tax=Arthrobacter sp. AZCC_0090 TaxID=2735881 RepID=UPI001611786C|nr:thioredoxin domain-containing protein [Arthrobacter sp. AZCC_0090]MBB6404196.1 protein-disulfide isomerase [Arthrobacter sp. AZCC_0090]